MFDRMGFQRTAEYNLSVGRDKIRPELKLNAPSIREKGEEKGKEPKATQPQGEPRAEKGPAEDEASPGRGQQR